MSAKLLPPLLPALQAETQHQREAAARAAFDLEAVRLALHQAAHKAQSSLRMHVMLPGLHQTDAAKKLAEWTKRERISLTWERRLQEVPDEGRHVEISEPEFRW